MWIVLPCSVGSIPWIIEHCFLQKPYDLESLPSKLPREFPNSCRPFSTNYDIILNLVLLTPGSSLCFIANRYPNSTIFDWDMTLSMS